MKKWQKPPIASDVNEYVLISTHLAVAPQVLGLQTPKLEHRLE